MSDAGMIALVEALNEIIEPGPPQTIGQLAQAIAGRLDKSGFVIVPKVPTDADEGEAAEQRYMDWLMRP